MTARSRWADSYLQYSFEDPGLLELALTHRSASRHNNERLEFLGDAFLSFAVAKRLYRLRVTDAEGDLSRARASLVNQTVLAAIGRELHIDRELVLGRGELRSGGAQRAAVLADAVEAVIGAVLLDGGHDAADALIERLLGERIAQLPEAAELKDPKTRLQEWLQGRALPLPSYSVEAVEGRDHEQIFTVHCTVGGTDYRSTGRGRSRRIAEQVAAAQLLEDLTRDPS